MKTRCPSCRTVYDVDPRVLQPARGLARCFRCDTVFNAFQNSLDDVPRALEDLAERTEHSEDDSALQLQESDTSFLTEDAAPAAEPASADKTPFHSKVRLEEPHDRKRQRNNEELPFEVPDNLEEIEPAEDVTLEAGQRLEPTPPSPAPWWQKAMLFVLLLALAAQLAWINRDLWIDHPIAIQVCAVLGCRLPEGARPQDFHVIEREMQLMPGKPPVLRLSLSMRNDARLAQPLPRLELSLLDAGGAVLARRLFPPQAYLPPDWVGPAVALPGEVITIDLKLKDPGPRARGFTIEFL